ncbi:MAG: extracellular solute-binding protein [Thermomicrobiales bacterium]
MPQNNNRDILQLVDDAVAGKLTRRDVLRRAVVLGLSIPAIGALLAACGDDDDDDDDDTGGGDETPTEAEGGEETPTEAEGGEMTATEGEGGEETPTEAEGGDMTATEGEGGEETPTEAEGGETPTEGDSGEFDYSDPTNPPDVMNAEAASEYSGASLTYYGDGVGIGNELDEAMAAKFTEATGIEIEVIPRPTDATETFSTYQRLFQAQSGDMDVLMLDVIWPGSFAQHLTDLSEPFSDDIDRYYETIVENNTVDGKLVGIPWFGDFGMLYYRTDLIEEYGFDGPPETWDELEEMATTIQEGEKANDENFWGFVFQGNAYEGLTCDGLEWQASSGGGTIVDADGNVTLNNEEAIAIFNKARGWVGNIAPPGVTTYQEEDARNAFQNGQAAFMRNWPYAYSLAGSEDSAVAGNFDVAPLPAQEGSDHVGTVGGWQIAVSEYSENQEAAIEFARYLTSAEVQKWRAVAASFVPAMPEVAEDPAVIEAMPFLETMADVVRVVRPSTPAGDLYNEVSTAYFQGLNEILNGDDAEDTVPDMADDIEFILG